MSDAFIRAATEAAVSIPEIFSQKVYEFLYANLVGKFLVNMDYAGEIKQFGDTVNIASLPEAAAASPITGGGAVDAAAQTQTSQQLVINKFYGYDVAITNLAQIQSNLNLIEAYSKECAWALAKQMDSDILTACAAASAAAPDHIIAGTGGSGAFKPLDDVLIAGGLLDAQNVPEAGRWMAMNPVEYNLILALSTVQSSDYYRGGQPLVDGKIPAIYGFQPYKTTLVAAGTVLFGHVSAVTLAVQKEVNVTLHDMKPQGIRATRLAADVLYGVKTCSSKRLVKLNASGS